MADNIKALQSAVDEERKEMQAKQRRLEQAQMRLSTAQTASGKLSARITAVTTIYGTARQEYNNEAPTATIPERDAYQNFEDAVLALEARGGLEVSDGFGNARRWSIPDSQGRNNLYGVIEIKLHMAR